MYIIYSLFLEVKRFMQINLLQLVIFLFKYLFSIGLLRLLCFFYLNI